MEPSIWSMSRVTDQPEAPSSRRRPALGDWLALGQGLFYVLTGVWPLVSLDTFMRVTGPKTDGWLVKTVGVLVTAIGGALVLAGRRRHSPPEIPLLAVGSALGLAAIDVVYVWRGRIARVYLADAVGELALVLGWLVAWRRGEAGQD